MAKLIQVVQCSSTTSYQPQIAPLKAQVMLPPCEICGEHSSGYHYGANTCEACKGFFRRCLVRQTKMECKHQGKCPVDQYKRRSGCAACRYQKCLDVGMSKDAIKMGRHTYEKKTKDIVEVNKLELQDLMTKQGDRLSEEHRMNELDRLIDRMTETHISRHARSAIDFENMFKAENELKEQKTLEDLIFGSRKALSRKDHQAIFRATGLDVDGRTIKIAKMTPTIEMKIENFLAFANTLPGFSQLPEEEQKALSKGSCLERWVFMFSTWYNTEDFIVSCPNDPTVTFTLDELASYTDQAHQHFYKLFNCIRRYQQLDLTDSESIVVAALSLMTAGCDTLSTASRRITSASADYLLEALEYLLKKHHSPEERTLSKIIDLLTDMQQLHDFYFDMLKGFQQHNTDLGFPEMFIDYM